MFAYLIDPSIFKLERYPIRVDTSQGISRGKTWAATKEPYPDEWKGRPLVGIAVGASSETACGDLIVKTLAAAAGKRA